MRADEIRTARLLLDRELLAGAISWGDLEQPRIGRELRVRDVPSLPLRILDQVRYKLGRLSYASDVVDPMLTLRTELLGDAAPAPPRFLIRVDEFPHYAVSDHPDRVGADQFKRFHEILASAGVPYLLAVLPRVSREPLSPRTTGSRPIEDAEAALLRRLPGERVTLALHGRDHRTRFSSPRRHSELCGLDPARTDELISEALAELAAHEIRPRVFVPPYNRFDARQLAILARHFDVVGGGPESIGQLGFQPTPQWRGDAVYLPGYAPFYGRAGEMLTAVSSMIEREAGLWVPVVLHWEWEQESAWGGLEELARLLAPCACDWQDFLAAVDRSAAGFGEGAPAEVSS